MDGGIILRDLDARVGEAVAEYWKTRSKQGERQRLAGKADQGLRSAVTGGAQMNGFVQVLKELTKAAGVVERCLFFRKKAVLPGFFRPTKEWDVIIVRDGMLLAAIELKSQAGPSFGNNFNNRTEEAMGSALDVWTAFREGAFHPSPQPFLGYFLMVEDCPASTLPVDVREPHFSVFAEFREISYLRRYELFCRKLVLERQYSSAALISSTATKGREGEYSCPAEDLSVGRFARSFVGHLQVFG